jgi:hypothetical protein
MKKIKNKVFFALCFSLLFVQTGFAQNALENKITTENGDILCVVSNGNKVPCEFVKNAEEQIILSKESEAKNGPAVCRQVDRTLENIGNEQEGTFINCTEFQKKLIQEKESTKTPTSVDTSSQTFFEKNLTIFLVIVGILLIIITYTLIRFIKIKINKTKL